MIINPPVSKKIKDVLKNNIKFSIFVHENPDCDALGSASALAASLKLAKKQAKIFGLNDDVLKKHGELFDLKIEPIHLPYIENSIAIILDTANRQRILNFKDDFKFSVHSDKYFETSKLTEEEKKMAQEVAKYLNSVELYMVGLDVADGKIMEVNVTSPCYFIREINAHNGEKFQDVLMDKLIELIELKQGKIPASLC